MPYRILTGLVLCLVLSACAGTRPYTLDPVKTVDPDDRPIPVPAEQEENFRWDAIYLNSLHHFKKPLDLNWTLGVVARRLGIEVYDEADNVNALDEVPNSSWYTNRHFHHPLTLEELRRGPDVNEGPDTSRALTIVGGKMEGVTPGFFIEDARGDRYLFKFDPKDHPELSSSTEVIGTKIYHAAGYNVPQNTIVYFDPARLALADDAGLTEADVRTVLATTDTTADGHVRALASKFIDGRPLGVWYFWGRRKDDPNDRVAHEERRELRGLSVLGAWLNDADRRSGNTFAAYVGEPGEGYVKHYLLDMGSMLGTAGTGLRQTKLGNAYRFDLGRIVRSLVSVGLYVTPWERAVGDTTNYYPAVGYFESEIFSPARWVPSYPNPAFEKTTPRDGYWGARLVTAFTDEQIRAVVDEGRITDPEAREYLIRTLIERRDEIGRYWFDRVNPLDRFEVSATDEAWTASRDAAAAAVTHVLSFEDLAVEAGLAGTARYRYGVACAGEEVAGPRTVDEPAVPLATAAGEPLSAWLDGRGAAGEERVCRVSLRTLGAWPDGEERVDDPVRVYLHYAPGRTVPRLAGIERL